jgi:hypothetical protein
VDGFMRASGYVFWAIFISMAICGGHIQVGPLFYYELYPLLRFFHKKYCIDRLWGILLEYSYMRKEVIAMIVKNPKADSYSKREGTHLKIDADLKKQVVEKATERDMSMAAWIEEAVKEKLARE